MEQYTKTVVTFGVLVMLLFGLYFFSSWFSKTTGYVLGEDEKIKLAQCLSEKNFVFYYTDTCPSCDSQRELFGKDAWEFVNTLKCDNVEDCPKGVPAWERNSKDYLGVKELNELVDISGCSLEIKS